MSRAARKAAARSRVLPPQPGRARPVEHLLGAGKQRARLFRLVAGGDDDIEWPTGVLIDALAALLRDVHADLAASGHRVPGSIPALKESKRSPGMLRSKPSAICERAEKDRR